LNGCEEPYVPPVIPPPVDPEEPVVIPEIPEEPSPPIVVPEIQEDPKYSYVYTYTNKTGGGGHGNFTYPLYDIKTTRTEGNATYIEGANDTCPCDLGDWETGEKEINEMVEKVAESVSQQQALLDEQYFKPLLADPSTYEDITPESTPLVGDDVDNIRAFEFLDGTRWELGRDSNLPRPAGDTTPEVEE